MALTSLVHTKCFNHGAREAVARCPECKRHYCRECVTEHEHRLLCASCIAARTGETETERRRIPFAPPLQFTGALVILWITFYTIGQMLLLIPSTYHDNRETIWDELERMEREEEESDTGGDDNAAKWRARGGRNS